MTKKEYLLLLIAEECNEVGQRASKALRFGLKEIQPGQPLNNTQRLIYEFNDLVATIELMDEEGMLDGESMIDRDMVEEKKIKIEKYLSYSQQLGIVR